MIQSPLPPTPRPTPADLVTRAKNTAINSGEKTPPFADILRRNDAAFTASSRSRETEAPGRNKPEGSHAARPDTVGPRARVNDQRNSAASQAHERATTRQTEQQSTVQAASRPETTTSAPEVNATTSPNETSTNPPAESGNAAEPVAPTAVQPVAEEPALDTPAPVVTTEAVTTTTSATVISTPVVSATSVPTTTSVASSAAPETTSIRPDTVQPTAGPTPQPTAGPTPQPTQQATPSEQTDLVGDPRNATPESAPGRETLRADVKTTKLPDTVQPTQQTAPQAAPQSTVTAAHGFGAAHASPIAAEHVQATPANNHNPVFGVTGVNGTQPHAPTGDVARPTPIPVGDHATQSAHAARQVLQVVKPFRLAPDGDYQMTLQLRPEALGRVELSVTMRDGQLSLQLAADNSGSRDLLRQSLNDLRSELEGAGIAAGSLDVAAEGRTDHSAEQNSTTDFSEIADDSEGEASLLAALSSALPESLSEGSLDVHV